MPPPNSALEDAIFTVVKNFHNAAANNGGRLKKEEFRRLLSLQLPTMAERDRSDQGLGEILCRMGVRNGEDISFEHFWRYIEMLATREHTGSGGSSKSSCLLL